jgi:hypothetical protein
MFSHYLKVKYRPNVESSPNLVALKQGDVNNLATERSQNDSTESSQKSRVTRLVETNNIFLIYSRQFMFKRLGYCFQINKNNPYKIANSRFAMY